MVVVAMVTSRMRRRDFLVLSAAGGFESLACPSVGSYQRIFTKLVAFCRELFALSVHLIFTIG